jgi:hypothetical protein
VSRGSLERVLLALIATFVAASAGLVGLALVDDPAERRAGKEFQSSTGGLGLGCQTDLSHGASCFDPRLADRSADAWPPELGEFDPWQSLTLLAPPIDRHDAK